MVNFVLRVVILISSCFLVTTYAVSLGNVDNDSNDTPKTYSFDEFIKWISGLGNNNNIIGSRVLAPLGQKSQDACEEYNSKAFPKLVSSIRSGVGAELEEFPHMALLGYPFNGVLERQSLTNDGQNISWRCGGSLISDKYVLTAAHCVVGLGQDAAILVRLGDLDWDSDTDGAEPLDFTIKKIILHPDYKYPFSYHDIALIELNDSVTFDPAIQPACLPSPTDQDLSNRQLIISGWGDTKHVTNDKTSLLMKAQAYVVSIIECNNTYMSSYKDRYKLPHALLKHGHVCAQNTLDLSDICMGDSGGPLQEHVDGYSPLYRVIGVTSIGKGCTGKLPALYVKIADYIEWIETIVWP